MRRVLSKSSGRRPSRCPTGGPAPTGHPHANGDQFRPTPSRSVATRGATNAPLDTTTTTPYRSGRTRILNHSANIVNLHKTWPMVMAGTKTPEEATFHAWPIRPEDEAAFRRHSDVVLGIFPGRVVTAYNVTGYRAETSAERDHERRQGLGRRHPRVVLEGIESETWRHLIDGPSPGTPFTRWPVQYIDTDSLT